MKSIWRIKNYEWSISCYRNGITCPPIHWNSKTMYWKAYSESMWTKAKCSKLPFFLRSISWYALRLRGCSSRITKKIKNHCKSYCSETFLTAKMYQRWTRRLAATALSQNYSDSIWTWRAISLLNLNLRLLPRQRNLFWSPQVRLRNKYGSMHSDTSYLALNYCRG